MNMTIEDSLKNIKKLQKDYQKLHDDVRQDPESYGIIAESLAVAVETMRKYQKIQKILEKSSYKRGGKSYSYLYDEGTRVKHIRKVMEDGNNRA